MSAGVKTNDYVRSARASVLVLFVVSGSTVNLVVPRATVDHVVALAAIQVVVRIFGTVGAGEHIVTRVAVQELHAAERVVSLPTSEDDVSVGVLPSTVMVSSPVPPITSCLGPNDSE
jgi:hypothetical protein